MRCGDRVGRVVADGRDSVASPVAAVVTRVVVDRDRVRGEQHCWVADGLVACVRSDAGRARAPVIAPLAG